MDDVNLCSVSGTRAVEPCTLVTQLNYPDGLAMLSQVEVGLTNVGFEGQY